MHRQWRVEQKMISLMLSLLDVVQENLLILHLHQVLHILLQEVHLEEDHLEEEDQEENFNHSIVVWMVSMLIIFFLCFIFYPTRFATNKSYGNERIVASCP